MLEKDNDEDEDEVRMRMRMTTLMVADGKMAHVIANICGDHHYTAVDT